MSCTHEIMPPAAGRRQVRASSGPRPATRLTIEHVECRPNQFASILDVDGRIDGASRAAFCREMDCLIMSGARNLVVDCEHVDFINSTGLGTIILYMDALERLGGSLVLAGMSDKALMVIELLGFGPALDIVEDQSQAAELFAGPAAWAA